MSSLYKDEEQDMSLDLISDQFLEVTIHTHIYNNCICPINVDTHDLVFAAPCANWKL